MKVKFESMTSVSADAML